MWQLLFSIVIIVWFTSAGHTRVMHLAAMFVTWLGGALVEPLLLPDPFEPAARWRFYWIYLPAILSLLASTTTIMLGGQRVQRIILASWLAALVGVWIRLRLPVATAELWECLLDVAFPALAASQVAVMVSSPRK